MQEIITGKPYPGPGSDGRPGSIYNCRYGQHQLTVFHDELTPSLLDEIARNPVQLGLWLQGPVLWILFKMAGITWQEAPFTPLLVEPEGRRFEPLQNGDTRYQTIAKSNSRQDPNRKSPKTVKPIHNSIKTGRPSHHGP